MDYVLVPGAWAGGWIWDEVASRLRAKGHIVHQLTLSGLKNSESAGSVRLSTHIDDVATYIKQQCSRPVVMVGHSYSGIVVGQVTANNPKIAAHTVFIESFLPVDGQSLLEVSGLNVDHEIKLIAQNYGLWPAPTMDELKEQPCLSEDLIALLNKRHVPHPGKTVIDTAILENPLEKLRATFLSSAGWLSMSNQTDLLDALQQEGTWSFTSIEGGHWPMLTIPDELSELLHGISVELDI
jgi:pimeloyl-ACP methyl ester carboxylesterase